MKIVQLFEWCLEKGKVGGKHRGISKILPDTEESKEHIEKALHNLKAVEYNIKGGFQDWAVSAAFYAMYHSMLALLYKLGYESRNQECTFAAIESLIDAGKLNLDKIYLVKIKVAADMKEDSAKTLRERFQYGTEVRVNKVLLDKLHKDAIEMVEAARIALGELG